LTGLTDLSPCCPLVQSNSAALDCCRATPGINAAQHYHHAHCTITCQMLCCLLCSIRRSRAVAVLSRGLTYRTTYSRLFCAFGSGSLGAKSLCAMPTTWGGNLRRCLSRVQGQTYAGRTREDESEHQRKRYRMDQAHHARSSELLKYCAISRQRFWQLRCIVLCMDIHLYTHRELAHNLLHDDRTSTRSSPSVLV